MLQKNLRIGLWPEKSESPFLKQILRHLGLPLLRFDVLHTLLHLRSFELVLEGLHRLFDKVGLL